jgi:tetratricopeptide (TPR) repeat protein
MFSILRVFRLGIRFAAWATPHAREWHRSRHLNRTEGERHLQSRNWSEAEKHFQAALAERKHPSKRRLGMLLGLEKAQRGQGRLAEAEQTARSVIEMAAKKHDHQARVEAMDALAALQVDQKKFAESEATVREITRLELAQSYPSYARLATTTRKLGTVLLQAGRKAEAMEAFQQSVKLAERAFGPDHVETAKSVAEVGMIHRSHDNHDEAQKYLRRALQIHRTALGVDSHEATESLQSLAGSMEESGDLEGAVGEYERLLTLKERQVGGSRERTAEVQVRLAALHLQAGNVSRARELLTHAKGMLERTGGPAFLLALETMASLEEQSGHGEAAQRLREKIAELAPQPSTPATVESV